MIRPKHRVILVLAAACCSFPSAADTDRVRFDGAGNSRTAVFSTDGPWMLDWTVRGEFPLLASFEMRLHDGASGKFIGNVVQLAGFGSGQKLFEDGGKYQIAVIASNIAWELEIYGVSADQAAQIKSAMKGKPRTAGSALGARSKIRESSFSHWRPEGDAVLLLFDSNGIGWRATFSRGCPGLESATVISFVAPVTGHFDDYDSILLEDGTRCYFDSVIPAVLD